MDWFYTFEDRGVNIRRLRRFALLLKLAFRVLPSRVLTLTTCFPALAGVRYASAQASDSQPKQQAELLTSPQLVAPKSKFTMTTDISLGVFG